MKKQILPQKINKQILLIDKPTKISSFGVVKKIRAITGEKKVGHAGTLDPLASGLMIILVGKQATKKANQFLSLDKSYEVEMTLGKVSSTGDDEGKITKLSSKRPTLEEIKLKLSKFVGEISQIPPIYSAIKIKGKRSYKLARQGEKPKLSPRKIKVYKVNKLTYKYPKLKFHCKVSSGTYIRSLVEDIGNALKTGAYTSKLRRTEIGKYNIKDALSLDKLG